MPVFNERGSLETVLRAVLNQLCMAEVIAVDDHSTDGSFELLERLAMQEACIKVLRHERHQGKGAALRTGISKGSADIMPLSFLTTECTENTEEDGELAYSESIKSLVLLKPISSGKADAVFGSRFIGSHKHRVPYFWHSLDNPFLTLTHMEAC